MVEVVYFVGHDLVLRAVPKDEALVLYEMYQGLQGLKSPLVQHKEHPVVLDDYPVVDGGDTFGECWTTQSFLPKWQVGDYFSYGIGKIPPDKIGEIDTKIVEHRPRSVANASMISLSGGLFKVVQIFPFEVRRIPIKMGDMLIAYRNVDNNGDYVPRYGASETQWG